MSSQSNLIFAVRVKDLPEHIRDEIIAMDHEGEEYCEHLTPELDDAIGAEWMAVVESCASRGLLLVDRKLLAPWEVELHCEPEYDEDPLEQGWLGVAITSRYKPTLADDNESGGCYPFVFDDRLRLITQFAEAAIGRTMPAWFRDAKPVWIVKESHY